MTNNPIRSDDPQALEKLKEKLEATQTLQTHMKEVNSYYRKNGTTRGCPGVTEAQAAKLDASVKSGYSWENKPYPSYELTNNSAEIRRLKQRIEQLSYEKEVGFVGWEFPGGEAVANTDNNRLQLLFDEKPSAEQRTILKQYGFHWSPSEQAWQRQLNENAIYAADRISFVQPESGISPVKLQPTAPAQEDMERE